MDALKGGNMTKEQFYDLSIDTLDDGTIRLEQRDYCGESVIIDLHPVQAAYIADGMPADLPERIQTQPSWITERIATLERRLLWMRDRFDECHAAIPSDMFERCPEAPEFYAWLMASVDVATEFCADFANAPSIPPSNAPSKPLSNLLESTSLPLGDGCTTSSAKSNSEHPAQPAGDLFADKAGR